MSIRVPLDGKGSYTYLAEYMGAYDGDSVSLRIRKDWDFGFNMRVTQEYAIKARIKGIDTPELRDWRPKWKAAGYLARDRVRGLLAGADELIFVSMDKPDKYGRALGDVLADGKSLVEFVLDSRLGVAYEGGTKEDVEKAHAANIRWLDQQNMLA